MVRIIPFLFVAIRLTSVGIASAQEPSGPFEMRTLASGSKIVVLRFQTRSGAAWVSSGGRWQPIAEIEPPPSGTYDVSLVAMELGYSAVRLERRRGQTWILRNQRWELIEEAERTPGEDRPR